MHSRGRTHEKCKTNRMETAESSLENLREGKPLPFLLFCRRYLGDKKWEKLLMQSLEYQNKEEKNVNSHKFCMKLYKKINSFENIFVFVVCISASYAS